MKSKNTYQLPVKSEDFEFVIRDSPAHVVIKEGQKTYDLTKAIDFVCNKNTEIYTALKGTVISVFNKIDKTWSKKTEPPKEFMTSEEQDGNYVVIKHSNKEFTIYSHFCLNGINVKEGEDVKTGQLLGYSGNTGWSMGPHLHFMIHNFPKENKGGYRSLIPNWEKGLEKKLNEKEISYKEITEKN